ncbi:MAG TPA: MBL fold metallo-hydrolase [Desulfotignum sp.]|nr:MBL fold metallo-hydrolase [Desulfotignum sp.]
MQEPDPNIPPPVFPMPLSSRVTVLGNYYFNLFLVQGDRKTALFEAGISAVVDTVIHQLEQLGVSPDYLILSHPHSDHATGLPGLMDRFPGARVLAGEGAVEFLTHPKAGPLMLAEDAFMSEGLAARGIVPGRPPIDTLPDLSDAREVTDTFLLDLGGISLELFPVAGHAPGNILGRVEEILFSSDSLGFHFPGRGFWPLFFTGAKAYLNTLEHIRTLASSIVCPAHQGPLKHQAAAAGIQAAIDAAQDFIQRVTRTQLTDQELEQQLFQESYRDEFTLYTRENIANCNRLLIKRARQMVC